jgi:chemotaxis protein MotB
MLQKLALAATITIFSLASFTSCVSSKKYKSSVAQSDSLRTANTELTNKVNGLQKDLDESKANADKAAKDLATYTQECEAAKQKLDAARAKMQKEYDIVQEVAKKIEEAEADFKSKGVEVVTKDGIIYVDMADNLLYKTGSATIGKDGKKALEALASALNDYPKLKVTVQGNTDDKKYKNIIDNWTLSTERANGVVRILSDKYKVDATRLTAAGKGKFNPLDDNSTDAGRAKNRRTEIILNPDWEKIWETVEAK